MTILSFKGRRDVEVHLFRSTWDHAQEKTLDWSVLIDGNAADATGRAVIMEAFTTEERDLLVNYLKEQYSTRLGAIKSTPLNFPVPADLVGLSHLKAGKTIGVIDFMKIPSYSLDIPMKGVYDLSQHPPIVEG